MFRILEILLFREIDDLKGLVMFLEKINEMALNFGRKEGVAASRGLLLKWIQLLPIILYQFFELR